MKSKVCRECNGIMHFSYPKQKWICQTCVAEQKDLRDFFEEQGIDFIPITNAKNTVEVLSNG